MHLSADGQPMGSVVKAEGGVRFVGDVHGVGPLDRVELVRFDGTTWTAVYAVDLAGAMDHSFDTTDVGAKPGYIYYLRVRQQDRNRAWSSPVWAE